MALNLTAIYMDYDSASLSCAFEVVIQAAKQSRDVVVSTALQGHALIIMIKNCRYSDTFVPRVRPMRTAGVLPVVLLDLNGSQ